MLIHTAKAILVLLVPAHEVEFIAPVFAAPLDRVCKQDPARRKLPVLAADTGVVSPELVLVIEVE